MTAESESTHGKGESMQKTALIAGGAKGIGREVGLRLGERSWAVALCYRKSRAEAEATALAIEERGGRALAVHADVSTPEVCAALVRKVLDWQGRIDAFIHCAGPYHRVDVLEETPAPLLPEPTRLALQACAVRLGEAVAYRSAGTVEFLYDAQRDSFHFLEVNTRLQVEHGVTEQVTGVDLVEWMVRIAAGEVNVLPAVAPMSRGASIQVRLYAEDPARDFLPGSGRLTGVRFPAGISVMREHGPRSTNSAVFRLWLPEMINSCS